MGSDAVNLWKGRDEEGKKEMKAGRSAPCPRRTGGVATDRHCSEVVGGWGGAGPGAVGPEDGCLVWLGAGQALQRRGQDAGCRELRGGCGRAEEGQGGHPGRSSVCKGPAPGDPGAVLRLGREEWSGHTGDPLASDISRPAQSPMRGKACLCQ